MSCRPRRLAQLANDELRPIPILPAGERLSRAPNNLFAPVAAYNRVEGRFSSAAAARVYAAHSGSSASSAATSRSMSDGLL